MIPLILSSLLALTVIPGEFRAAVPPCAKEVDVCVGIELFVVVHDRRPVQTPGWFAAEVAHANRLFASIDVGFELATVHEVDGRWRQVTTRLERDELGREQSRSPGVVHVFMVEVLDDVDVLDNTLYGVHWRDRVDVSRRWIILSAKDSSATALAHEMGHYFGLPHSSHRVSIMNKRPRETPSWPERIFAPPEVERMKTKLAEMVASDFLVPRRSSPLR